MLIFYTRVIFRDVPRVLKYLQQKLDIGEEMTLLNQKNEIIEDNECNYGKLMTEISMN